MSRRRLLGLSILFVGASACIPRVESAVAKPLKPEDGPKGTVHVTYSGGLLNRQGHVWFRTEQSAFITVAHLSGDGVITILYPDDPRSRGATRGKKSQAVNFNAYYDGMPSMYSFTAPPHRGFGALSDSYDGRGHGFVFMIASHYQLRFDLVSDGIMFDDIEVEDYFNSYDPRVAIREFADRLAGGKPFTLKFASSYTTTALRSYADAAWDCAFLWNAGFGYASYWSWGAPTLLYLGRNGRPSCGSSRYAFYDEPRPWYFGSPVTANPKIPVTPSPITPTLTRPSEGRRRGEAGRSIAIGRSPFDRQTPATASASRRLNDPDVRGTRRTSDPIDRPARDESSRTRQRTRSSEEGYTRPRDSDGSGARSGGGSERAVSRPSEPRMTTPREAPARQAPAREAAPRQTTPRSEPAKASEKPKPGEQ
jgi:hypothetical protein